MQTATMHAINTFPNSGNPLADEEKHCAHNYHPLPVVLTRGEGVWVWDTGGKRYLDCLSAYSALNQGHRHPRIMAALTAQAQRLTLTSRAFHNDRLGPFLKHLCELSGMRMALPMNTGAEAVETAIKTARKWGSEVRGVADGRAEIVVCGNNFHGRTTTICGFSSDPQTRKGFGPFTPGFVSVPFGDIAALEAAITDNTVAFMVEPIQGEAGVIVPPEGYLRQVRELCSKHGILMMLDEIQTGLGRTGTLFCYEHESNAIPDVLILGKALGGGVMPVSAVLASEEILGVFRPGDHGSTFGGNPLAAAVADEALAVIVDERLAQRAREQGAYLLDRLRAMGHACVREVRGRGLLVAIELTPEAGSARAVCETLMRRGVLVKETHEHTIRIAPPLVIDREAIDHLLNILDITLAELSHDDRAK